MKTSRKITFLATMTVMVMCVFLSAKEITVPGNHSTIQAAIDAAGTGDIIIVSPDTYVENINFKDKDIIVRSTDPTDPDVVSSTIIDGDKVNAVVIFGGSEPDTCKIAGFTITNGRGASGGGIIGQGSLATIENNVISTNTAWLSGYGKGGGINDCDGLIQNNVITGNTTTASNGHGGGLGLCDGIIRGNTITYNKALGSDSSGGGAIYKCDKAIIENNFIAYNEALKKFGDGAGIYFCTDATIQNNIIVKNKGSISGGISSCSGTIQNNTVYGNESVLSADGAGMRSCKGGSGTTIRNNIVWGNSGGPDADYYLCEDTPTYCCIGTYAYGGTGCFQSDPKLSDPANEDFSLAADSPCVDAGMEIAEVSTDIFGTPRPQDGTDVPRGDGSDYDIGAVEFMMVTVDTVQIVDHILGITELSPSEQDAADLNENDEIEVGDVIISVE